MNYDEAFIDLLKAYPDAVNDRRRLSALLKDVLPGQNMQVNLLCAAYDLGIAEELQKTSAVINGGFAYRYAKRMIDDYGVSRENADWAIAMWCACYGGIVLRKSCNIRLPKSGSIAPRIDFDIPVPKPDSAPSSPTVRIENTAGAQYNHLFTYVKTDDGYGVTGFTGQNRRTLVFPSMYNGQPVTRIMPDAFKGDTVQEVVMTASITDIGDGAFKCCNRLTQVVFPATLRGIGRRAFSGCGALRTAVLPESLLSIESFAFSGAALRNIRLPAGIRRIGGGAFGQIRALTRIELPRGITDISDALFYGCTALTEVRLSEDTQSIGTNAFNGCASLREIVIPDSVQSIGVDAFDGTADRFTILCHRGSYAESYARAHHIAYRIIYG